MKRTMKSLLACAAFATLGVFAATSASATPNCQTWPVNPLPGASYPLDGRVFNCMPAPRNTAEVTFQNDVLSRLNSATGGDFNKVSGVKTDLSAKLVDIVIAYDRGTAETKSGLVVTPRTTKPTETGRTLIYGLSGTNLNHPTTLIWVFRPNEWVPGTIPTTLDKTHSDSITGTAHHEFGHQMDRVWAQYNGFSPSTATIVNNTTNNHFLQALQWDIDNMSAADKSSFISQFPQYVYSTSPFLPLNLEMYAEEWSKLVGGNLSTLDTFIDNHFTCSRQFLINESQTGLNGATPTAPTAPFCYGHRVWN